MPRLISTLVAVLGCVLVVGCGGGSKSACGTAPCGGDVVGSWTVTEACLVSGAGQAMLPPAVMALCPQVEVSPVEVGARGNITFNADRSFSVDVTGTATATVTLPASCLSGLTCAQANSAIAVLLLQNPDPRIRSFSCSGSSDCECAVVIEGPRNRASGTYTISGSSLTSALTGVGTTTMEYCARGNTLVLNDPPVTNTGVGDIMAIVAQK